MTDWTTAGSLTLGCIVILFIGQRVFTRRNALPLPPGPSGLPWIGNVIGINTHAPWITYANWARTYGDIIYSRLLGKAIIIINSEKVAKDLLENRSKNYSDRPNLATIEMCGLSFNSVLMGYSERWRLHRRLLHQTFRLDAVHRFLPYQHRKACHLLEQLLDTPEQLSDHIFVYTASVTLKSVYDYDPASREDEIVNVVAKVLDIIVPAMRPDVAVIASALPLLLRLPSWLPGMSFKKEMEIARAFSKDYLDRPFEYALQRVSSGSAAPSMVQDGLQLMEEKGTLREESNMTALKEASGSVFMAASETSNSFLMTFFLMMMLNPEVQRKAQAQIDAVVGKTRLPTIEDRPLLSYIDAIIWETIRYCPVTPLSVPHATSNDDVYNGFHIPKGAVVLANLWAMGHDESRYPNPNTFIPERFLNDDGSLKPNDVEHIAFGFGRRICAGRHFAEASLCALVAKVLAVFKILKPLDKNGLEIQVEPKFSTGITIHPLPFKCRIVPRFGWMDVEKLKEMIAACPS